MSITWAFLVVVHSVRIGIPRGMICAILKSNKITNKTPRKATYRHLKKTVTDFSSQASILRTRSTR